MKEIAFTQKSQAHSLVAQYSAPKGMFDTSKDETTEEKDNDILKKNQDRKSIYSRESDYHKRRFDVSTINESSKGSDKEYGAPGKNDEKALKKRRIDDHEEAGHSNGYIMPTISKELYKEIDEEVVQEVPGVPNLQFFKPSDRKFFAPLLSEDGDDELTEDGKKQKQILKLVLRIKNGFPSSRKVAMRTITLRAEAFGTELIFDNILPIMLDKTLEDQERQLMLKLIERVMNKLRDSVKPYTHKLLIVLSPMLIDSDPLIRETGREIISKLATNVGLSTMITTMRPDIDHEDEYVRNTTARSLAVVSKTLGVSHMIPFLRLVCKSKRSWKARHTGIKVIQQISLLMKIGILPYLNDLVDCIVKGFSDEHSPVRIITAQTIATMAQGCQPYGIEAFSNVLEPIWRGIKRNRGRELAAMLKAMGFLIPLMDPEYAGYYTQEVMRIVRREFDSPNDEMKKTILFVIQKCVGTEGITGEYLKNELSTPFFRQFWVRRTALDRQISKIVTYTTVVLAEKIGCAFTLERLLAPLKDESEPFRFMAIHAISRTVKKLGTADVDDRLEARLIDALLIAFQEQVNEDHIVYKGFGSVAQSLDKRMKPYIGPIVSTILEHLKHRKPMLRTYAANLCNALIPILKSCGEIELINKLNIILFESLGEVYPEVLGAILFAIDKIAGQLEFSILQPPPNQILPTLTPILRNNNVLVQQATIKLVGKIARRGPDYASPKEWMRICFELLEMLKSPTKSTRRAANKTFGYIAKAIGPQDVLVALLNNLKVQERQLRICSSVAIGIVAKTCGPFIAIPALMNEYRTPDTNVQNGVLKALAFMLEYIGDAAQDYIYVLLPLLQDALTDRDLVHRQTAATCIKHLGISCQGRGLEDAFIHSMNLLMPNIFETSPHVISRIHEGLEALRVALGPGVAMNYVWTGLFHSARHVRKAYWKLFNAAYISQPDALVPYYPTEGVEELNLVL